MVSGLLDDVTRGQADGVEWDLRGRTDGEVRLDAGSRGAYSTDASNFRQVPIGVVLPRTPDVAVEAVAVCRAYDVPVLSRGGGTSLAGQCTNAAVMLDWSKYCHRIESEDEQERTCIIEPGIVLDLLNENLSGRSLRFGPEPWISSGQLSTAKRVLRRTVDQLAEHVRAGGYVVGLEPSCTAVFRSDAAEPSPDDQDVLRLRDHTVTLAELLTEHTPGWEPPPLTDREVPAQVHCHQHAVLGWDADAGLLESACVKAEHLNSGMLRAGGQLRFSARPRRGEREPGRAGAAVPAARRGPGRRGPGRRVQLPDPDPRAGQRRPGSHALGGTAGGLGRLARGTA